MPPTPSVSLADDMIVSSATDPQVEEDGQPLQLSVNCVSTQSEQLSTFAPSSTRPSKSNNKIEMKQSKDTFALMMIKKPNSLTWLISLTVAAIQIASLGLIYADQTS